MYLRWSSKVRATSPLAALVRRASQNDAKARAAQGGSYTTDTYKAAYVDAYVDVLQARFTSSKLHPASPSSVTPYGSPHASALLQNVTSAASEASGAQLLQRLLQAKAAEVPSSTPDTASRDVVGRGAGKMPHAASFGAWREPSGCFHRHVTTSLWVAKYNLVHQSMLPHVFFSDVLLQQLQQQQKVRSPVSLAGKKDGVEGLNDVSAARKVAASHGPLLAHASVLRRRGTSSRYSSKAWVEWQRLLNVQWPKMRDGGTRRRGDQDKAVYHDGATSQTVVVFSQSASSSLAWTRFQQHLGTVCDRLLADAAHPSEALCVQLDDVAKVHGWQAALRLFAARFAPTVAVALQDPALVHSMTLGHVYNRHVNGRGPSSTPVTQQQAAAAVSSMLWASLLESMRVYRPWHGGPPPFVLRGLLRTMAVSCTVTNMEPCPDGAGRAITRHPSGDGRRRNGRLPVPSLLVPMWIDLLRSGSRTSGRRAPSFSWQAALQLLDVCLLAPQQLHDRPTPTTGAAFEKREGKADTTPPVVIRRAVYLPVMAWEGVFRLLGDLAAPLNVVQRLLDAITLDVDPKQRGGPTPTPAGHTDGDVAIIVSPAKAAAHMRSVRLWNGFIRAAYCHPSCDASAAGKGTSQDDVDARAFFASGGDPSDGGSSSATSAWADALLLLTVNMRQYGVAPTADTYAAVGESLVASGRWMACLTLLRSKGPLGAKQGRQIPRCASTYIAAFAALGMGGQHSSAFRLLVGRTLREDFQATMDEDFTKSATSASSPSHGPAQRVSDCTAGSSAARLGRLFVDASSANTQAANGSSTARPVLGADERQALKALCRGLHAEHDVPPAVLHAAMQVLAPPVAVDAASAPHQQRGFRIGTEKKSLPREASLASLAFDLVSE